MIVICSYCGSECHEREQAAGRCGSCACFFTGAEEVMEASAAASDATDVASTPSAAAKQPASAGPPEPPSDSPSDVASDLPSDLPAGAPLAGPTSDRPSASSPAQGPIAASSASAAPSPTAPPATPPAGDASGFDPTAIKSDSPGIPSRAESAGLIQPRKLSPQFRRHVEKTWQSTFGGSSTSEHTLSSGGSATETKSEPPTLSIATRSIKQAADLTEGAKQGDYRLDKVIGEGSMGRVWSARQNSLDRNVAVKVPMKELANSGSVGESQFISEVVVTGQLEHPNIVPIYELGRDENGVPFYSMKHVQGKPWNELIDEKSDIENLEILMKLCDAVAFAHDRNFLHRDIKPHNVMVGQFGEVSVMDWGIAVAIAKDPNKPWASVATGPAGTPAYMAPEMAAHNPSELGVVSDIYLIGAVLYEIVTGTPPHPKRGNAREALLAAAANEIVPTDKSGELIDIAYRAMATNPYDRYQSVQELQDAIREFQSHSESIKLSESAEVHLDEARQQNSSDEFARARFAFEESVKLWAGNTAAVEGLAVATLDHAQNALEQENFELGISILDPTVAEHQGLIKKLKERRNARRRLAMLTRVAVGVAILAVVGFLVASYRYSVDQQIAAQTANDLKDKAENDRKQAVKQRDRADRMSDRAEILRLAAVDHLNIALVAEASAREEKLRAEEAGYGSEIGLAAESIRQNQFNRATSIMDRLDPAVDADPNSLKPKLRHIEWGILKEASQPPAMLDLSPNEAFRTLDSSADGSVVVAGTEEGQLHLWHNPIIAADDQSIRKQETLFQDHSVHHVAQRIDSVAISADGKTIAVAGLPLNDQAVAKNVQANLAGPAPASVHPIWIFNREAGLETPVKRLVGHQAEINCLTFSKTSNRLASSASDRTARVWDYQGDAKTIVIRNHLEQQVWSAGFSPHGKTLATACEDGRVRVWRLALQAGTAEKIADFRGHQGPVYCVVFTPDGEHIVSGGFDRQLLIWKPGNGEKMAEESEQLEDRLSGETVQQHPFSLLGDLEQQHDGSVRSIRAAVIEGHTFLLSASNDNTIRLWSQSADPDIADPSWNLDKVLRGHGRWVRSAAFIAGGQEIISAAFDGAKVWRWQNYSMPRTLFPVAERRMGFRPSEIGLSDATVTKHSPDQRWIATGYAGGTIAVWDMASGGESKAQRLIDGHDLLTSTGQFYDSGNRLLTAAGDNTTRLWDVQSGTNLASLIGTGFRGTAAIHWNDDQQTATVVTGSDNRIAPATFWVVNRDGSITKTPLLGQLIRSVIDRQLTLASGNKQGKITLTSLNSEQHDLFTQLRRQMPVLTAASFNANGDQFIVGDSDGNCYLFDHQHAEQKQTCQLKKVLRAHGTSIVACRFIPNSNRLVTASSAGQVALWDAQTYQKLTDLPSREPVMSVHVSSDGKQLIVGHAPIDSRLQRDPLESPVCRVFDLSDQTPELVATLLPVDKAGSRDWSSNQPTVQSVQFAKDGQRALVSLYFPTTDSLQKVSPYVSGFWQWNQADQDFATIDVKAASEVASTVLLEKPETTELLVVGGKGAKLLKQSDSNANSFETLTASFRPSTRIESLDFANDPLTGQSTRLVMGDNEGNLRVWDLLDGRWSEQGDAAVHLVGAHLAPIVMTEFFPSDPSRFLSVDRTGRWLVWTFDQSWSVTQEHQPQQPNVANCARLSHQGNTLLVGNDTSGLIWKTDGNGQFQRSLIDWQSGRVERACFAHDDSWMVTCDDQGTISIWDDAGEPVTKLVQQDTQPVNDLVLTNDRLRMITAQGKQIVIWDLGGVGRGQNQPGDGESSDIKELLSNEAHRMVTSISLSPDNRSLVTAGTEGQTILWNGAPILPISLSGNRAQFAYQSSQGKVALQQSLMLHDPSLLADFRSAVVYATITDSDDQINEELSLLPIRTSSGRSIEVREVNGAVNVMYIPSPNATARHIGTLSVQRAAAAGNPTTQLECALNENADQAAVQTLLRSIAFQFHPGVSAGDHINPVAQTVTDENSDAENQDESDGILEQLNVITARQIEIGVKQIGYHDSTATEDQQKLYPTKLSVIIDVELEDAEQINGDEPIAPDSIAANKAAERA